MTVGLTHLASIVCVLSLTVSAHAQTAAQNSATTPDVATTQATSQTQTLLRDPSAREKAMTTPDAKNADKQVKNLVGPDSQALYELAADILPTIVNDGGGDPIKIQANLDQLAKNPESISNKLSTDQMARIQELAKRVESRQPAATSAPH